MELSALRAAAFAAGVVAHQYYFKPFEHHLYAARYVQLFALLFLLSPLSIGVQNGSIVGFTYTLHAASDRCATIGMFLGGLYTSLLVYRGLFHRLNKFPGPFLARLSDLWYSSQLGKADAPHQLLKLHRKYGHFLRIGSSSLSITHPDAVQAIYGMGSKCTKAPWYDQEWPYVSLHTLRSRTLHDKRRRVWSQAFSDKTLRGYEERVQPYTEILVNQLRAYSGQPVNVSDWFKFFSFDVMGDLAFNESFRMLETGENHWAIKLLHGAMEPFALNLPEWLFRVILAIPGATGDYWKFLKYCQDALNTRMKQNPHVPDIMKSLLTPYEESKPPEGMERALLESDTRLIIIAGSDTTAAALTHLFYYLCKNPEHMSGIHQEIQPYINHLGEAQNTDLLQCDLLNGCINESLRLNPPVPTAVQRMTPREGMEIGGQYIPGNCKVWAPQYVVSRNRETYVDPESFIPERWFSKLDLILDGGKSFAPFSLGPMSCIGKPLALMEMRTTAAKLLGRFEVDFAPGEDGMTFLNETRDHFTLGLADLKLVFKARKA